MAVAIIISTFGCNNGLILAGSRVACAMAKDGLFFRATGKLNSRAVPGTALVFQGVWITVLLLLRTRKPGGTYGNLYSDLLNYVVFAVLIFYVLTIAGIFFVLRKNRPDAERPYRAFGYPVLPIPVHCLGARDYVCPDSVTRRRPRGAAWLIVLLGVPVYLLWSRKSSTN